ncbi:MAG: molybdopterin cofactor-binding domain-containing protein [Thermodesulfobacteriota bacterium]|jgi:CO/xanthine dehydrogenase Mo-binding subunit
MEERELLVVGQSFSKIDGLNMATGKTLYTADMKLPRMLYGKILRSPHPHALIKRIDTSKLKRLSGVKAVINYENVPRVPYNSAGLPSYGISRHDEYIFDQKVRFHGDRVAAVAAVDKDTAEEAIHLIDVEYELLDAVFDPEEALRPEAPEVQTGTGKNVIYIPYAVGDIEKGFQEADDVFEDRYVMHPVHTCCMEPTAFIADVDSSGKLTVYGTTQVPNHSRRILSQILKLPMSKIRVVKPPIGGGFGSRQNLQHEGVVAMLALKTGLPVKIEYSREEEFFASTIRHPAIISFRTGIKRDGTLTGWYVKVIANAGAYTGHTPVLVQTLLHKNPYRIPHEKYEAYCVYTNLPNSGAFRGYGNPQISFARECHLDRIAEALKIDPIEIRVKNKLRVGDVNPLNRSMGWTLDSCGLEECLRAGARQFEWEKKRSGRKNRSAEILRGVGVACMMHLSGQTMSADCSSAIIKLNEDGTTALLTSAADLGQGSNTAMAQIAAEVLGLKVEDIVVMASDTDITPFDMGTYASRQTYVSGNAVKRAAEDAKAQLVKYAATMLSEKEEDLEIADRWIYVKDNSQKRLSLGEVVNEAQYGKDRYHILGKATFKASNNPPPFAATFTEVEVNRETGTVKVLRVVSAHDVGKAINPKLTEGQIEGGIFQGIGYALTEEIHYDSKTGRTLNADFFDYKIPCSQDMPVIEPILIETLDPTGPFGAKGVGESSLISVAPSIANAVYDAIGVRIKSLPITGEKILEALREKG